MPDKEMTEKPTVHAFLSATLSLAMLPSTFFPFLSLGDMDADGLGFKPEISLAHGSNGQLAQPA